jgi:hypothetical protein
MNQYHDISSFLETSRAVLSQIVQHNHLADARIRGPVEGDLSVPSLYLRWGAGAGIAKKINLNVFDELGEAIAEVEINAWMDIERSETNRSHARKFRRMVSKSVETLRNVQQYERAKAFRELNAALWQAYVQASQLDLREFQDGHKSEMEAGVV